MDFVYSICPLLGTVQFVCQHSLVFTSKAIPGIVVEQRAYSVVSFVLLIIYWAVGLLFSMYILLVRLCDIVPFTLPAGMIHTAG